MTRKIKVSRQALKAKKRIKPSYWNILRNNSTG